MSKWPMVPLNEILQLQRRWVKVDPTETYEEIGVRCFGNGIFHKAPIAGSTLGNKRVLRIEPGDLVFNNVFAWEGAVAVASDAEAGKIGSHRFVTYTVNPKKSSAEFLRLFFRSEPGLEILRRVSPGSAGRNRTMNLDQFINKEIPMPAPAEQQCLVEKIDALAEKINEAKRLRNEATTASENLFSAAMNEHWKGASLWTEAPLGQIASTVVGQVDPKIEPYASLPHINGESIESGTGRLLKNFRRAKDDGVTSGKYHFPANSLLYSKIRPYLRKSVQVPFEGICSADIYAFDHIASDVEPRFLMYSLIGPRFTSYANELSGRTRMPKLNQDQLFAFQFQYPSKSSQQEIVAYLDRLQTKVGELASQQAVAAIELDALLPAILDRAFRGAHNSVEGAT